MKRQLLLIAIATAAAFVLLGHPASAYIRGQCTEPADTQRFPYGFLCSRDATDDKEVPLVADGYAPVPQADNEKHISVPFGTDTIKFTTGFHGDQAIAHINPSDSGRNIMMWATINIDNDQFKGFTNVDGQYHTDQCPGTSTPSGGERPGPVWAYGGRNAGDTYNSPYANSGDAKTDCGTMGQMIWWEYASGPSHDQSFTLHIKHNSTKSFCVRTNVSIGTVGVDTGLPDWGFHINNMQSRFPPSTSGKPWVPVLHQDGSSAEDFYYGLYNSVASHIAKKSDNLCVDIVQPVPSTVGGNCSSFSWSDPGYWELSSNPTHDHTYSKVTITGAIINGVSTNSDANITDGNGENFWNQVGFWRQAPPYKQLPYNPDAWFPLTNLGSKKTWNFVPGAQAIDVHIQRYAMTGSGADPWNAIPANLGGVQDFHYDCLHMDVAGGCSIAVSGGLGPGGVIIPNQQYTVTMTLHNPGPNNLTEGYFLTGWHLGVRGTGGDHNLGRGLAVNESAAISFTVGAPGSGPVYQHISFTPAYNGQPGINLGGECSKDVPIYQEFNVQPGGSSIMDDNEDPSTVTYATWVTNNNPFDLSLPTSNQFYKYVAAANNKQPIDGNGNGYYPANKQQYNLGPSGPATYSVPPKSFQAGDRYCSYIKVDYTHGWRGPGGAGDIVGASAPFEQSYCPVVNNKPYFKVYGNGISAGGDFQQSGSCSTAGAGQLAGWFNNTFSGYGYGASTNLSALAIAQTVGVASAQTSLSRAAKELSLSNTVGVGAPSSDSPLLGGNYGGSSANICMTSVPPPDNARDIPTASISIGSAAGQYKTGKYSKSGNLIISDGTVGAGSNLEIYVDGDVYIDSDVTYGDDGSWNKDNVPQLLIQAKGNIYISNSVHTLDGTYIALPRDNNTGSTIYTCGTASGSSFSPVSAAVLYTQCNNQLTVHGTFSARKVNMMRTYGSLRDEKPTLPTADIGSNGRCPGYTVPESPMGLCWEFNGPIAGWKCTKIWESADPNWNNDRHYLCVDPTKTNVLAPDYSIAWWRSSDYPNWVADHTAPAAKHYCTIWSSNEPGDPYAWGDNQMCSNIDLQFKRFPMVSGSWNNLPAGWQHDGGNAYSNSQYCTRVFENNTAVLDVWQGTYICEPRSTVASPPAGLGNSCSNMGVRSFTRIPTCAAEVFDFSPEVYLKNQEIGQPQPQTYDIATGLPPVL